MVAGSVVREQWFRSPISNTVVVVMRSLGFVAVALPRDDDDDDEEEEEEEEEEEAVVEAVLPPLAKTTSLAARCKVATMPRIPPLLLRGTFAATKELFADNRLTSASACKSTPRLSRRQTDSPAADPLLFCCLASQFQFQPPLEASFAVKPVEDEWFTD